MTDELRPGPKRYRIRVYDNNYEVMPDRIHCLVLDLDTAAGMSLAEGDLDRLRLRLAALVRLAPEELATFRLAVHTWPANGYVMDWSGRA